MSAALLEKQKELIVKIRQGLKLEGFAAELENQYENMPIYAKLSFEERLLSCVEVQDKTIRERKCANLISKAKFKDNLRLTDLTQTAEYGLTDALLSSLASLEWIVKWKNVIITGSCGVGKSGLSCALGYNCCINGISVRYYRTSDLLLEMSVKQGVDKIKFMRNLAKFKVLILDDFGISPLKANEAHDLFNVIDDRYKSGSTIIATQLKSEGIKVFLGTDIKAEATFDRLMHPSILVELKGPSRRK